MNYRLSAGLLAMAMVAGACGSSSDSAEISDAGSDGGGETAAAGGVASCVAGEGDGDLSFYNWVDYMDEGLLEKFTEETGIKVDYTLYESNEAMLAQVDANAANYDLVVPSDYMLDTMIQEDLVLPLNFDAIPNSANMAAEWDSPPFDTSNTYHVAYQWGTTGIGISQAALDAMGNPEPTWGFIFDPALRDQIPGGVSMLDDSNEAVSAALKYLGYSIDEVMTSGNEEAIREAGELLKETTPGLVKFDSVTFGDDVVNGEVGAAHGWSGSFATAFFEAEVPEDFVFVIPKEGGVRWVDTMAVPKTAEHPCSAHAMINFLADAENGATLTNFIYYASPNEASIEFILPEILEDTSIYPDAATMAQLEFIPQAGDLGLVIQDVFSEAKG